MHRTPQCATLDPDKPVIGMMPGLAETSDERVGPGGGRHRLTVENTTTDREEQVSPGGGSITILEQDTAVGMCGAGNIWHGGRERMRRR